MLLHLHLLLIELVVELVHIASVLQGVLFSKASTVGLHCFLYGAENGFILDGGWEFVKLAFDDLPEYVSEDLAASGFWELVDN